MIIGRMKERLELLEPVRTPNGSGGYATVMTSRGTVWAEKKKPDLKTEVIAGAISSVLLSEFNIRYHSTVKKGWQGKHEGRTYSIEHTFDYGKQATVLICREVVK